MTQEAIVLTDPARELAELCGPLQVSNDKAGEVFLAERFQVKVWSPEFYQIIFTIIERCALVQRIITDLDVDDDYRAELITRVSVIMNAFSANAMKNGWSAYGQQQVSEVNVGPLKAISGLVRQRVAYRKLTVEEVDAIQDEVITLLAWLNEHQLAERDFIRQALIDGLEHFKFRLSRLQWLGWGYTLDSLREVISAYMLLERSGADPATNPDAAAVLQKVGGLVKDVYKKVSAAKEVSETGDWLLKAYGVGSLVYQAGKPLLAGFLGSS